MSCVLNGFVLHSDFMFITGILQLQYICNNTDQGGYLSISSLYNGSTLLVPKTFRSRRVMRTVEDADCVFMTYVEDATCPHKYVELHDAYTKQYGEIYCISVRVRIRRCMHVFIHMFHFSES